MIVCSDKMSAKDAYVIGTSTFRALRHKIPEIEWMTSPPGQELNQPSPLMYQLHPGAVLIRDGQQPSGKLQWLNVFFATFALWGAVEVLRWLNSLFDKPSDAGQPADQSQPTSTSAPATAPAATPASATEDDYTALKEELDEHVVELERAPLSLDRRAYAEWRRRIDDFHNRIVDANRSGRLSLKQTRVLLKGVQKELASEYEIRKPAKRRKTRKSAKGKSP